MGNYSQGEEEEEPLQLKASGGKKSKSTNQGGIQEKNEMWGQTN